ncbi:MAG TPA: CHAT domain-containing protein, partial [Gemmatimonadales bacterium]|nr:CHAT domain-containing protein [Gemmatimonadales bacterium]
GARRVLATLWRIDDRSAAAFMTEFHRQRLETGSMATALAQAQRRLLHAPGTRTPVHWAAFTLSGVS